MLLYRICDWKEQRKESQNVVTHLKRELQGMEARIFDPSTQVADADGSPDFKANL